VCVCVCVRVCVCVCRTIDYPDEDESSSSRAVQRATAAHEAVVSITVQLKQLELLAAQIQESANRSSGAAADAGRDAEDALNRLDAAQKVNAIRHALVLL